MARNGSSRPFTTRVELGRHGLSITTDSGKKVHLRSAGIGTYPIGTELYLKHDAGGYKVLDARLPQPPDTLTDYARV